MKNINKSILILVCAFGIPYSLTAQDDLLRQMFLDAKNNTTTEETISNIDAEVGDGQIWHNAIGDNFFEIQKKMQEYYATRPTGRGTGYKQWKRWEEWNRTRLLPDSTISNFAKTTYKEFEAVQKKTTINKSLTGNWQNLGPNKFNAGPQAWAPGLGRINCIAFHPSNANIIYIGAPAGGLWKTIDGGTEWEPLFQDISQIGVSGIAISASNPNKVFVLSGDGDAGDTQSVGVFKSLDAGMTWTNTTLPWGTGTTRGYKLWISNTNDDYLLAATAAGLFLTLDGGTTWSLTQAGNMRDVEVSSVSLIASSDNDVYRYTSATGWTTVTSNVSNVDRIAIARVSNNISSGVYYQLRGGPTGFGNRGVYKSTDHGASFSLMSSSPNILGNDQTGAGTTSQSWYDLALIVNNSNTNQILTGGVNLWGSTNSGSTMSIRCHWNIGTPPNLTLPYVHADIHALEMNPLDGKTYCGSDGGIFVSSDFGTTWTDLSDGISVSQLNRIDGFSSDSDALIMSAQDNGTFLQTKRDSITNIFSADGQECKLINANKMYISTQLGFLSKSLDGGLTTTSITPPNSGAGNNNLGFMVPFDVDPSNSEKVVTGYINNIHVTTNGGSSWSVTQPAGGTNIGQFRYIYIHTNGDIYACTNTRIYKSPSNVTSSSWTDVTNNLPVTGAIPIRSINANGSGQIFVTLGGLSAGNKVFFLNGAATSWTNISYDLPNQSVNCIDFNGNNIYVGTDIGVFRRVVAATTWTGFSHGVPNQSVPNTVITDIDINQGDGVVYVSTYARGIWISGLYGDCAQAEYLTSANDDSSGNPNTQYIKASRYIESNRLIDASNNSVIYQSGGKQLLKPGFQAQSGSFFKATSNKPCSYVDPDG